MAYGLSPASKYRMVMRLWIIWIERPTTDQKVGARLRSGIYLITIQRVNFTLDIIIGSKNSLINGEWEGSNYTTFGVRWDMSILCLWGITGRHISTRSFLAARATYPPAPYYYLLPLFYMLLDKAHGSQRRQLGFVVVSDGL